LKSGFRVGVVLLLAFVAAAGSDQTTGFAPTAEERVLLELNQSRAEAGLPALKFDAKLQDAARRHSLLQQQHEQIAHQFSGEPPLMERLHATGLFFTDAAENVGMNTELYDINAAFLRSPGHRANMLSAAYDAVGIGIVRTASAYWVTEDFAKLTPALSAQQAEDMAAVALQTEWKRSHALPMKRVSVQGLRSTACYAAHNEGKLQPSSVTFAGQPAQQLAAFSTPDPSALTHRIDTVLQNTHVSAYAVAVCTPEQSGDYGQFWVVIGFF
jgi:hypothetical protein